MSGAAPVSLAKTLKRSIPSVFFSTVCFGAIYADWNHTRKWKQNIQLQKEIIEEIKTQENKS